MQRRIFEFRADDKTVDFNGSLMGIVESGVYRGYDAHLIAGLTLELVHTQSGATFVDDTPAVVENVGILRTKQGTVIRESAPVEITIGGNNYGSGHPSTRNRIDLIVCEHWHQDIVDGVQAIYYAIPGTQASNPVPPALTNPSKQMIIGTLFLPGNCVSLDTYGVKFTKASLPLNPSLPDTAYPCYFDETNKVIKTDYLDRAYYYIVSGGIDSDYPEVRSFDLFTIPNMVATIISDQKYKFVSGYGIILQPELEWSIAEAFEEIQVYMVGSAYGGSSGSYVLVNTARLYKNQVNKLYKALIGNIGTTGVLGAGALTLEATGNIQKITVSGNADLKSINTFAQPNTIAGFDSGMQLIVQINTADRITVKHLAANITAPYKNIYIYGKRDIVLSGNITLYLYEDQDKFVLFQWNADVVISTTAGPLSNRNGVFCGTGSSETIEAFKALMVTGMLSNDLLFVDEITAGASEAGNKFRYTVKIRNAPTVDSDSQGSTAWLTYTELSNTKKTGWQRLVMTEDDGSGCNGVLVIDWGKLSLTGYQYGTYKAGALFGITPLLNWTGDNSIPLVTITGTIADVDGSSPLYVVDAGENVVVTLKTITLCANKFTIKNVNGYVCRVESDVSDPFGNAQAITVNTNGGAATFWKNGAKFEVTGDYEEIYL